MNMKTPEEFVKEYYQLPHSKIETVRIKSLIKCIERYKEYHDSEVIKLNIPAVSNRRELFDKFYEWLDGLSQTEYDDMSLTDKCEKFFFKT
jgi:hypothetical protein